MSTDRIPMSKEGYEKKKAQLDYMKNEDMPRIAEQIALARGFGDLSENAEFDAAVEAQGMLQARINDLQNKLGQAYIVEKSNVPTDRVVYGSKVRVLDLESERGRGFYPGRPGRGRLRPEQDPPDQPDRSGIGREDGGCAGRGPDSQGRAQAEDRRDRGVVGASPYLQRNRSASGRFGQSFSHRWFRPRARRSRHPPMLTVAVPRVSSRRR